MTEIVKGDWHKSKRIIDRLPLYGVFGKLRIVLWFYCSINREWQTSHAAALYKFKNAELIGILIYAHVRCFELQCVWLPFIMFTSFALFSAVVFLASGKFCE